SHHLQVMAATSPRIIVIGAGIIGLSSAIELQQIFPDAVDKRGEQFYEFLDECTEEFENYMKRRNAEIAKCVGDSIEIECFHSRDNDNEMTRIENFDKAARAFLENLSIRIKRSLNQLRMIKINSSNEHFTDKMMVKLELLIDKMKSHMWDIKRHLIDYRKAEKEEIRKLYDAEIAENENFKLYDHHPDSRIPTIDLAEFANTKQPISRGGEGAVFRYEIPGHLLKSEDESVTVAAKKFEASSSSSSYETRSDAFRGNDEIMTLFQLRHPNIVQILGRGSSDGDRCLLIEYSETCKVMQ
ncbi:hypothetical protein PMAYCL1PPCAC_19885, partial [Pristionchus mayeri]